MKKELEVEDIPMSLYQFDMQKLKNKYMKTYDKNKELSYLKYRDAKNLYGRALSQKLQVNGFK